MLVPENAPLEPDPTQPKNTQKNYSVNVKEYTNNYSVNRKIQHPSLYVSLCDFTLFREGSDTLEDDGENHEVPCFRRQEQ